MVMTLTLVANIVDDILVGRDDLIFLDELEIQAGIFDMTPEMFASDGYDLSKKSAVFVIEKNGVIQIVVAVLSHGRTFYYTTEWRSGAAYDSNIVDTVNGLFNSALSHNEDDMVVVGYRDGETNNEVPVDFG